MSSVIRGSDNFDSEGIVEGTATAWVNFNGTGTVAIRDSYNVSSITDNGTGLYAVNFFVDYANANYCVSGSTVGSVSANYATAVVGRSSVNTVSDLDIQIRNVANSGTFDHDNIMVIVHGGV